MQTEEHHGEHQQGKVKYDYSGYGPVNNVTNTCFGLLGKEISQKLGLDYFKCKLEHKYENGWREVGNEFVETQIEKLEADEEDGALIIFA